MNFSSLFLGRVDYEIYDTWKAESKMEFVWKSESQQMFTVINSNLYVAPETFCWDSARVLTWLYQYNGYQLNFCSINYRYKLLENE